MTNEQQQKFSDLLDKEEARLREELSGVAVKDPALPGGLQPKSPDFGEDFLNDEELAQKSTASNTNATLEFGLEEQLEEVLKAKEKLKTGRYGVCETCGEEISVERLEALPM